MKNILFGMLTSILSISATAENLQFLGSTQTGEIPKSIASIDGAYTANLDGPVNGLTLKTLSGQVVWNNPGINSSVTNFGLVGGPLTNRFMLFRRMSIGGVQKFVVDVFSLSSSNPLGTIQLPSSAPGTSEFPVFQMRMS